jgi:hypothetical protein
MVRFLIEERALVEDGILVEAEAHVGMVAELLVEDIAKAHSEEVADLLVEDNALRFGEPKYGDGDSVGVRLGGDEQLLVEDGSAVEVVEVGVEGRTIVEVVSAIEDGFPDTLLGIGHTVLRPSTAPVEHHTHRTT